VWNGYGKGEKVWGDSIDDVRLGRGPSHSKLVVARSRGGGRMGGKGGVCPLQFISSKGGRIKISPFRENFSMVEEGRWQNEN